MGPPHSFIAVLPALAVLLLVLLCAPSANGAITNTTIDDTNSAFTFSGSWTAVSPSDPCAGCSSKPDASQTFGETWHDGNYRTGASETTTGSFTFTGSAVYIFGIDQANSQPDIAFTLGSTQAVHHYTGTERFAYNALFFHATGLAADQTHTVNWIFNIDPSTGVGVQAALFDYAIVTSGTNDAAAQPSAGTSSAAAASPRTTTSSSTKSTSIASATSAPSANTFINSQSSSSTSTAAIQNQSATSSSTCPCFGRSFVSIIYFNIRRPHRPGPGRCLLREPLQHRRDRRRRPRRTRPRDPRTHHILLMSPPRAAAAQARGRGARGGGPAARTADADPAERHPATVRTDTDSGRSRRRRWCRG
ncbi:hypothetical protein B0H10DRAFT_547596 [Mycena sp. CBHHK59/15]|nr:hypothetical protein B0H10DRAFT_547596 [Mycena sp. CBHHK59/15]